LDILRKRGFGGRWLGWIKCVLHRGSIGLTILTIKRENFSR
jgi:hypothetical protein